MMSPYHSHRNQTYFPDPETFNPVNTTPIHAQCTLNLLLIQQERWLECDIDKNQFLPGFIAFGGGRYQCPGRYMSMYMYMHYIKDHLLLCKGGLH